MSGTITQIHGKPIVWPDMNDVMHCCEIFGDGPGARHTRTRCLRDVPANSAMVGRGQEVTCPKCLAAQSHASPPAQENDRG